MNGICFVRLPFSKLTLMSKDQNAEEVVGMAGTENASRESVTRSGNRRKDYPICNPVSGLKSSITAVEKAVVMFSVKLLNL